MEGDSRSVINCIKEGSPNYSLNNGTILQDIYSLMLVGLLLLFAHMFLELKTNQQIVVLMYGLRTPRPIGPLGLFGVYFSFHVLSIFRIL